MREQLTVAIAIIATAVIMTWLMIMIIRADRLDREADKRWRENLERRIGPHRGP